MDPLITSALVSLGTTWATSGAKAPAHTLNLLWKITLGRWDPLMENMVKENVKKYAKDITDELKKIPPDAITLEPDISLIGPALEASKYYVEKEILRKMFARLISASIDKRKENSIHHAFVEIIKQMNPLDAKVLSVFENPTNLLHCTLRQEPNATEEQLLSDIYLSDDFPEYDAQVSISIANLSRLGLIDIPTRNMGSVKICGQDSVTIARFRQTKLFAEMEESAQVTNAAECQITTYPAYLTSFGFSFRKICL